MAASAIAPPFSPGLVLRFETLDEQRDLALHEGVEVAGEARPLGARCVLAADDPEAALHQVEEAADLVGPGGAEDRLGLQLVEGAAPARHGVPPHEPDLLQ